MALSQINLKVDPEIAEDWQELAKKAGYSSVREWMLAELPTPSQTRKAKRERTQLTIQASPDLIAKVRQMAEQRRQTVTAVVVEALEAWIAGDQVFSAGDDDLAQRVADLERRIERLEITPPDCQNYPGFGKEIEDIWSDFLASIEHTPSTHMLLLNQSQLVRVDQFRAVLRINSDWLDLAKSQHDELQYFISVAAGRHLMLMLEAAP